MFTARGLLLADVRRSALGDGVEHPARPTIYPWIQRKSCASIDLRARAPLAIPAKPTPISKVEDNEMRGALILGACTAIGRLHCARSSSFRLSRSCGRCA